MLSSQILRISMFRDYFPGYSFITIIVQCRYYNWSEYTEERESEKISFPFFLDLFASNSFSISRRRFKKLKKERVWNDDIYQRWFIVSHNQSRSAIVCANC